MFGYFHGMMLQFEFEHLDQYLDLVQEALTKSQADFEANVQELIRDLPPEDQDQVAEGYSDDFWILNTVLPGHLYVSFMVTWYSLVETELVDVCKRLHREKKLSQGPDDLPNRHKGQYRARLYLKQVAKIPLVEALWQELGHVNQIRNLLVHNGPVLKYTPKEPLLTYLEKHQLVGDLVRGDRQQLTPNLSYCKHLVQFGRDFFTNLLHDAGWTANRTTFARATRPR